MRRNSIDARLVCVLSITLLLPVNLSASELFQPPQVYLSGGLTATSVAVGDLNGDGKPDLVVANVCTLQNCDGGVGILLGNGDGTFQTVQTRDIGVDFATAVAVADVNGDGKLDIMVTAGGCSSNGCFSYVNVLLGNGDGTFGPVKHYPSGNESAAVAVADVNGDGKPDLLVANLFADPNLTGNGAVAVLLGNGDGTFGAAQSYDSGSPAAFSLAVSDLNGDGKLDVVLVHERGVLGVLLGNGDGTFQAAQTYSTGGQGSYSIAIADVNGDGKPDVLVTNEVVDNSSTSAAGVLLGNGDGTLQPAEIYSTRAIDAQSIAVADVNGDGKPDLIVAHANSVVANSSPVAVLLGNGDGTFMKAQTYYSGGNNALSIVVADVNGDGKPDLIVGNKFVNSKDHTSGSVGVLLGLAGVRSATKLSSSLNPSVYGQAVTLTATVTSVATPTPTGTVKFEYGTTPLGTAKLSGGVATLTKTTLPAGTLSVTATYNGDPDSAPSTSAPLIQSVRQASTTTTIKSSLNPSVAGQPVTFTAAVFSATAQHVTGTVTFTEGSVTLGIVALSAKKASLTTSTLPQGSNQKVTATYGGTANTAGSAATLSETVN